MCVTSVHLLSLQNSKAKIVAVDAARRPGAALACDYRTERDVIGLNRSIWRGRRYRFKSRRKWRLFATRSPHKFPFTVRADEIHLPGATRAKSAFVSANVGDTTRCERGSAFFTCAF